MISLSLLYLFLVALLLCNVANSNKELITSLKPDEIAIIQYDSRMPLSDYWLSSALWNKRYCDKHGHKYIYFTTKYENEDDQQWCEKGVLASPWCKVKAMVQADIDYTDIKVFIYMDSDAIIDKNFENQSLNQLLILMQSKLDWNVNKKPLVFNQDGPCWWCTLIKKIGYKMCLNAGTVVWYRHHISEKLLVDWWNSAMDSYETNPIKRKFRIKWPWEQDRQMAIYNRSSTLIQIASQPDKEMMDKNAGIKDWCLSHLPGSGCFISHHCSNAESKSKMRDKYKLLPDNELTAMSVSGNYGFDVVRLR